MAESDIQLITGGSGPVVRTLQVTTLVNGVPTVVQMEVAAISDAQGNVWDFSQPFQQQEEIVRELKGIRKVLMVALGVLVDPTQEGI